MLWAELWLFFSIWVFFHDHSRITGMKMNGEGISVTPDYHLHSLHWHSDISLAITAESSPLHIPSKLRDDIYIYIITELIYLLLLLSNSGGGGGGVGRIDFFYLRGIVYPCLSIVIGKPFYV